MKAAYFYLLPDDNLNTYTQSVCRVVDQIWSQGLTLFLYCSTEEKSRQFDDDLWTFKDIRFIPHVLIKDQASAISTLPICIIGSADVLEKPPSCPVLFNLTSKIPDFFENYEKIIELVPVNETGRVASRNRYKQYQKAKYDIKTRDLSKAFG